MTVMLVAARSQCLCRLVVILLLIRLSLRIQEEEKFWADVFQAEEDQIFLENDRFDPLVQEPEPLSQRPQFFLEPQHVCTKKDITLLVLIFTRADNRRQRFAQRETWIRSLVRSRLGYDARVVFVTGADSTDEVALRKIRNEQILFLGEMMQMLEEENYKSVNRKMFGALEWTQKYCPQAKFVLKTDDDTFIFPKNLERLLKNIQPNSTVIYGRCQETPRPINDRLVKWAIEGKFSAENFTNFCKGPSFLMSQKAARKLYEVVQDYEGKLVHLDDVFYTGILAQLAGIERRFHPGFLNAGLPTEKIRKMQKRLIALHGFGGSEKQFL